MTVKDWLGVTTKKLEQASIGTARLDSLVLLEDVFGKDRAYLLAHPEAEISADQQAKLEKLLKRRVQHEPIAYIRGKTEFYGREFIITPAVLEPRPESETMIDLLKELYKKTASGDSGPASWRIADMGTGSGALGITAALELPSSRVELLEIDQAAINIAKLNVDKFTLNIKVIFSDLLEPYRQPYDVLLCNLPYVPDDYQINLAATKEPKVAIFGGPEGLNIYHRLFRQVTELNKHPLYILTESFPAQHAALEALAIKAGYLSVQSEDFIQVFANK